MHACEQGWCRPRQATALVGTLTLTTSDIWLQRAPLQTGAAAPGPGARPTAWPARACPKLSVFVAIAVVTDRNAHAPVGSGSSTSPAARRPRQSARMAWRETGSPRCM